ncbi:MAG: class I tRNA ligase family protein, partial [Fervidobacterium sp.]
MAESKCKQQLSDDFKKAGYASYIWELTGNVVCRCSTKNHVKILENQWFLKFSDSKWKELAKKCIKQMKFYPEQARKQFEEIVEWLEDKACARKSGLGTRLPWDKDWIVETLSDSVIYMAFYTIAKYINAEKIEPHYLKEEVFDFIFWNKGKVEDVAKTSGIRKDLLKKMREEFDYWYGQDMRASAKELIPNHFTFSIFHHVAVWPDEPKRWPHAYTINGMQQMNGKKMSKSKGNFITIQDAVNKYSADAMRITLMDSTEGMDDPDWTETATLAWKSKLNTIYKLVKDNYNKGKVVKKRKIDVWLESRLQIYIKHMTEHLEKTENKSALTQFHMLFNDLQWYLKRSEPNKQTLNYVLETIIKILAPYTPFICEETWNKIGKRGFVSLAEWPSTNEKLIDNEIIQLEEFFKKTCEDLKEVIKLSQKNEKLYLYFASPKELEYFKGGLDFMKKEFGFKKVEAYLSSDPNKYDPENKAKRAKFG